MLLSHEFFAEGVKIEPLKGQGNNAPVLDLKMEVPTKETSKKNNQESIPGEEVPSLEEESEGGSVRGVTGGGGEEFKQQQQLVPTLIGTEPPKREDRAVAYSPKKRFLKYDIEIGRGSFKTVYKALDTETGVAVAWCELQENRYIKSELLRLKDEVIILKTLQHPNILRLYEVSEITLRGDKKDRNVLVLVTELMTSGTLKGYMRRLKAIKPKVIRSWGRQILQGLHFLHTRTPPIIHRNLKCDNIFINGTTGLVKIGDFGLATLKRSDVKTVIGTPEFMAPEMYEEKYDESVDVYAFGMCLLEMCTQEYPYMECSNPAQIYRRVTRGVKPEALERVKNEVLLSIITNCIVLDRKSRYTVKMLLSHEFFAKLVKIEPLKGQGNDAPVLDLKMEVPTKETSKKNNQESIEFSFDLEKDTAEGVVSAMVKSGLLRADEQIKQNCVRSLRDYVDTVRQKRRQVNKDKEEKSSSQQLSSGSESNIGDSEQLSGPPELQQQLSSNEGSPQAGQETSANGEESYLEAYNHFIHTKESLDLLFLKFLFVGPPRLGKTTLRRRLLKEIIDLISAGEADKSQPSTGAVESSDVVVTGVSSTTAVITESEESEWSKLAGLVDEAQMLFHSLMSTVRNTSLSSTPPQLDDFPKDDHSYNSLSESSHSSLPVTGETQELPVPVSFSDASSSQQEARLPRHILKALTILREAMGSDHWKSIKHMFKVYMRMEDTGGQPELMDMLPALTLGPGLYLLFINLQNDLNHHYKLTYCNSSGESTPPVESVYSVKEMFLSSLSSISCSNACSSASKLSTSSSYLKNALELSKSVAYIVGTHKDKVSNGHIKKWNEDLKNIIMFTEFYKQNIVQFASEEDLIIAIDNMAGGAEEVQKVKKLLEDTMTRHFKKLKIPAVWLFFSLFLRDHDKRTVSLDYCMELSSTLGMSAHETEVALWFLHHHAGVLMYFPNVPELKDLVIIDVQVVYDSVTVLILQAMSYKKVGHSAAKEFKKTGKFTKSCITAITHEVCGDHIPIDKLVALLEFLHIIARICGDQSSQSSACSQEEVTYMMPCVLSNASKEQLDSITKELQEVPPMLLHFTCGAVPIGLFPALISSLITTKPFTLIQDKLYKNNAKFRYGCWRTLVVFSCYSTFYQISISTCSSEVQLHQECDSIRQEIVSIFPKVTSRFNYGSLVDYQLAFDCPIHPDCNRQHLCVIDRDEDLPQMMDCMESIDNPHPVKITNCHKQWFGQIPMTVEHTIQEQGRFPQACTDEDKPSLRSLMVFKCTGGRSKNILNEIGADYYDFGIILLNDDNGKEIESLIHKHLKDPKAILRNIFKLWLEGQGQPVSWHTLISVLEDVGLTNLAKTIQTEKL